MGGVTAFAPYSASPPSSPPPPSPPTTPLFFAHCFPFKLKLDLISSTGLRLLSVPNHSKKKPNRFFFSSQSLPMASTPSANASSSSSISASRIGALNVESERAAASSGSPVGVNDMLIVGPGVLGRLVAKQWREFHPECQVYGQTLTADHHGELIEMGIKPSLAGTKLENRFPYVIFCAPPSRSPDYPADVREAVSNWNGEGTFLFTSSSAPYDCFDNGYCDENTPSVSIGRSPRTDVLLKAEKVVLDNNGCVLRLAGLYEADRGVHIYYVEKGTVEARPDYILNLIHYKDAASLAIMILKKSFRRRVFLGCDNHPLSCQEIMNLVNGSGKFCKTIQGFTGTSSSLGKRLNNLKTRAEIGWEPKYPSLADFLQTL